MSQQKTKVKIRTEQVNNGYNLSATVQTWDDAYGWQLEKEIDEVYVSDDLIEIPKRIEQILRGEY